MSRYGLKQWAKYWKHIHHLFITGLICQYNWKYAECERCCTYGFADGLMRLPAFELTFAGAVPAKSNIKFALPVKHRYTMWDYCLITHLAVTKGKFTTRSCSGSIASRTAHRSWHKEDWKALPSVAVSKNHYIITIGIIMLQATHNKTVSALAEHSHDRYLFPVIDFKSAH